MKQNKLVFYKEKYRVQKMSRLALLFALSLAFSYFESFLPAIGGPFPLRYGLSNIPLMYAILTEGLGITLILSLFKAGFALATRGTLAGLLSLGGGIVSALVMFFANKLSKGKISFFLFSVLGAVSHNITQLFLITLIFPDNTGHILLRLLPPLLFLGILSGAITALILHSLLQNLQKKI